MSARWELTCDSRPDGGVILTAVISSRAGVLEQEMPFDRDGVAQIVMIILVKAGITGATYADGSLTVRDAGR
jgi:hypothetical protein